MKYKIILFLLSTVLLNAQPMTEEKFIKYKEMAPQVLDIMNNQTKIIVSCFEHEESLRNINQCSSKTGKTIETMISKLIPKQFNSLCKKDLNGQSHFDWNKQNYKTLIIELKKTIYQNEENKKCIQKSKSVEIYAKCLTALKV